MISIKPLENERATTSSKRRKTANAPDSWESAEWGGPSWKIFCDQAATAASKLEDASVDCVITSPPYFWLRDYNVEGQIGLEDRVDEYVENILKVMHAIQPKLKKTGLMFLNIGDTYYSGKGESQGQDRKSAKRRFGLRAVDKSGGLGIGLKPKSIIGVPWRVALKMCLDNWVLRCPIIWNRVKCLPEAALDRPRRTVEYLFMFSLSRRYFFNRAGLVRGEEDIWNIPVESRNALGIDTAPFPKALVKRCLDVGCPAGGVVLDPFCGSGTTLEVAVENGRHAIGFDLNREFCQFAAERMQNLTK